MEKPKKYEDVLMTAFHFDVQDLEANQAGRLTDWQRNRLKAELRRSSATLALFGFGGIVVFAAVASIWVSAPNIGTNVLLLPLIMIALVSAILVFYWTRSRRAAADLNTQELSVVEGRVSLAATGSGEGVSSYSARVGAVQFPLKQHEFLAFKNGDPYRIYYAPQSKRILSLEWLRDADDNLLATPSDDASLTDSALFTDAERKSRSAS